jgi:hypothetical protein
MAKLSNVKDAIRATVSQDSIASSLAAGLVGLFEITYFSRRRAHRSEYTLMFAKPTKTIKSSLSLDREILVLIANFSDLHASTISHAQELIREYQPRLDPAVIIILHGDSHGDDNLRTWGREAGITILPIYKPTAGAIPPSTQITQRLAQELFAADSFQITGPVSDDSDFFGRREQALDLLRQLREGKIAALFGLRKVGKTSMLNRIIDLARSSTNMKVAMIDCSLQGFNKMEADEALQVVARLARVALEQGYAHVSQALNRSGSNIHATFDTLWDKHAGSSLLLVLDEIDYITPDSPTAKHWLTEFSPFWRELRAVVQEAKRHDLTLSLLVCGVSSLSFRLAEIDNIENPVLHFIPEDYLSPFPEKAADAMIRTLGNRCGLQFSDESRQRIAETAAFLPFWMRMLGSYIHRSLDISERPMVLDDVIVGRLCSEFADLEGAEIARVAIQNLRRVDPPMFDLLIKIIKEEPVSTVESQPLVKYGLVKHRKNRVFVESALVLAGVSRTLASPSTTPANENIRRSFELEDQEWAEELAAINRRRNILERKTRDFVRIVLRMREDKSKSWDVLVLEALQAPRREQCRSLASDALMSKLYWIELSVVIRRYWTDFEAFFHDKRRTENAFEILNERPDTHAKDVDLADVALQRRELAWLEERIAG